MKNIGELIDYLMELPADAKLKGVVEYDEKKQELLMKRSSRKTKKPNVQKEEIQDIIQDQEARLNFREFILAWGQLYSEIRGEKIYINMPRDIGIVKNTFPMNKDFGAGEIEIIRTYLEIFDDKIKTPTYKQPTLGGLKYALNKVNQAMAKKKVDKLKQANKSYEISEEVF